RTPERLWRWYRRHRVVALTCSAVICSLVTATVVSVIAALSLQAANDRERRSRERAEERSKLANDLARSLFEATRLEQLAGRTDEATKAYAQIQSAFGQLREDDPENPVYPYAFAKIFHNTGDLYYARAKRTLGAAKSTNYDLARENFEKARSILESL